MSSGVTTSINIMSDIVCPTTEPVGAVTNAPPRAPTRTSMRPIASSARSASRTVTRETLNCSASSRSGGRRSPFGSLPPRIAARIWSTIDDEARVTVTGANMPPSLTSRCLSCRFAAIRRV
jgi:hypothetical protein